MRASSFLAHASAPMLVILAIAASCAYPKDTSMESSPEKYWSDPKDLALAKAIQSNSAQAIDYAVDAGANVNAIGADNMLPLFWAVKERRKAAFERLLQRGADPNQRFDHYGSLLHALAVVQDDSYWLKIALKHNGKPDLDPLRNMTPLFFALESRRRESIALLIAAGADLNHRDRSGQTPIAFAATRAWFDSVHQLLEAGADPWMRDDYGYDLQYAVVRASVDPESNLAQWKEQVIDLLTDKGLSFAEAEIRVARDEIGLRILGNWLEENDKRINRWLRPDAEDARAYRLRGAGHLQKEEYDAAIADFTEAIRLDPKNAAGWQLRGRARYDKCVASGASSDEVDDSVGDFTEAIRLDAKRAAAYAERATAYAFKGKFDQAISDYGSAISLEPHDARSYDARGQAWRAKGELDKALSDYDKAIRIDGQSSASFLHRGNAWSAKSFKLAPFGVGLSMGHGKEEHEKAIADYTEAIRYDAGNALAYARRAELWEQAKRYDRAIDDYAAALRIEPDNTRWYSGRGRAYDKDGQHDRAVEDFSKALELSPETAIEKVSIYQSRGEAWLAKKEYDRALQDFDECLVLYPDGIIWVKERRRALRLAGRFDELIAELKRATETGKRQAIDCEDLALVFAACPDAKYRDAKKAIEYATKACELTKWESPYALSALAAAYAEARKFRDAIKYQLKAVELAKRPKEKTSLQERLKLYENGKPYREIKP